MKLIQTIDDLSRIRDKTRQRMWPRLATLAGEQNQINEYQVLVCSGTGCTASRSQAVLKALNRAIADSGLEERVRVVKTGCFGFCKQGPIIVIYPDKTFYCHVQEKDVEEIVNTHLQSGQLVEKLLYREPDREKVEQKLDELLFFEHQQRIALRNCGVINPEDIQEYIALDGYLALANVLIDRNPARVIEEIIKSGLRGRGGAGFLTGRKWQMAAQVEANPKFVVCNADEGDPGAFMDRSILEGDPHSVLEAMAIAGYCIGANRGYIYIRAEYPLAVERLEIAIAQAKEYGMLGSNIFGSGFDFSVEIRLGAGAFVCGEETALLRSITGRRGEPRPRPPFPAVSGLWNQPTLVNNVETFANIPVILRQGADWYASIGTEKSKGTKVFALAGQINNTGLIEVPMGTTLRTIIYRIGGGIPHGKKFKAVQTGGPSGGCIPAQYLDTPIDYESLAELGSMMGSGGMIVMDESDCMVDIARFYLEFSQDESCGKCTPCRIGTKRLLEIIERITQGKGEMEDLELLEVLSQDIKEASLCGLGQSAPNPVLSTLRYFREEYEAHIKQRRCPAGVCRSLFEFRVSDERCIACGVCARVCPVDAAQGKVKEGPFTINQERCIKCGACEDKCPADAIYKH
ncbi:MAG: NADH-quinone oxidoreductase subunit NuoF [Firmicutes bacterium]|nr:NADH-quinone oxidoreductase subunit NuoF [Bacillota bacterium]